MAESSDIPLCNWINNEARRWKSISQEDERRKKEVIVREATVAYGIVELLKLVKNGSSDDEIKIENFAICVNREANSSQRPWDDIQGISMISTGLSLTIEEPSYLSCLLSDDECVDHMGRYLEVELVSPVGDNSQSQVVPAHHDGTANVLAGPAEKHRCQLFAKLLYQLFSHQPFPDDSLACMSDSDCPKAKDNEPAKKKTKTDLVPSRKELMLSRAKGDFDNNCASTFQIPFVAQMQQFGVPASICLMTQNLLEIKSGLKGEQSGDAYCSLDVVCQDLHLLLLDPERFLFDREIGESENVQLLYRNEKLYGRDKEESLITDAFCRVSRGKSEAFFIGGFSGSGKSKLVNSLRARVDAVGGYVLTHKYDELSKERPLFGVVSALNQLCLKIKERNTPEGLLSITNKLKDMFGDDCWLLASLLPNVSVLSSEFTVKGRHASEAMNLRSVCYTLLRFVRVVSSPVHPIMVRVLPATI